MWDSENYVCIKYSYFFSVSGWRKFHYLPNTHIVNLTTILTTGYTFSDDRMEIDFNNSIFCSSNFLIYILNLARKPKIQFTWELQILKISWKSLEQFSYDSPYFVTTLLSTTSRCKQKILDLFQLLGLEKIFYSSIECILAKNIVFLQLQKYSLNKIFYLGINSNENYLTYTNANFRNKYLGICFTSFWNSVYQIKYTKSL